MLVPSPLRWAALIFLLLLCNTVRGIFRVRAELSHVYS